MRITFSCPNCATRLEVGAETVGAHVECPGCKASVAVPRTEFGPGTTIGGFRITSLLGKGGMGEVWLATQLSLDREVALKVLPSQLGMQRDAVQRFLQEVRLLARLDHPNIVTAYEAGEDAGILFLAMALVHGESLETKLHREGAMSEKEALRIVDKVAHALAYAWDQHQLLHRDVKPSNILIDAQGEPKLVDLGLAKSLVVSSSITRPSSVMGTPNYMSPEQAEGFANVDCRADMYSLGLTLYHMLTGQVPFEGTTPMHTLRKQLSELLPDPRKTNPQISEPCVAMLETVLAKKPDRRHKTWEDFVADIRRVQQSQHPSVRIGVAGDSMMMRRRAGELSSKAPGKRLSVPLMAAGVIALFALVGVMAWGLRGRSPVQAVPKPARGGESVKPSAATPAALGSAERIASRGSPPLPASVNEPLSLAGGEGSSSPEQIQAATLQKLKAALAKMQAAHLLSKPPTYRIGGKGITLFLDGTEALTDLSPLEGLPIISLSITGSGIKDLRPLASMPLEFLVLTRLPVHDLTPISKITSLTQLSIYSCVSLQELSPLHDMRQLTALTLAMCPEIHDLTPLAGLKLEFLNVNLTAVRDVSALRGMPLRVFVAKQVDIKDMSPVVSPFLQEMHLGQNPELDLDTLAGAKLSKLYLTRLKQELTPLKKVLVEELVLEGNWEKFVNLDELPSLLPGLRRIIFSTQPFPPSECPEFIFRFPCLEGIAWTTITTGEEMPQQVKVIPVEEFKTKWMKKK